MNFNRDIEAFKAKILTYSVIPCRFKVGDKVMFINDYGVPFLNQVIGFDNEKGDLFKYGNHIFLDKDSYWFPVKPEQLKSMDDFKGMVIGKELLKLKAYAKNANWHESSLIELTSRIDQLKIKASILNVNQEKLGLICDKIYKKLSVFI